MRVKVLERPIRYGGVRYSPSDIITIEKKHYDSMMGFVEVVEENIDYEKIPYHELRSLLSKRGFKVGHKSKKELLDMIEEG